MTAEELKVLKEISKKLDQVVILLKISNQKTIEGFKKEIKRDKVSARILDLADGTITYSELAKKVAEETGAAEITVKKKISALKEMGFLTTRREGKEVYYENSGLFD